MGLFRTPPWQVRYGPYYIPATVDENEYGIYVSFALLFVAWLLLLPLQRCAPKPMLRAVAVLAALALGLVIIVSQFTYEWHSASVHAEAPYAMGYAGVVSGRVGLHIGLRGFNITLVGEPQCQFNTSVVWNEHITWADPTGQLEGWQQGRLGFGAYASPISQQFRDLAYKGVPRPILDVAEWFTIDGERLRWARWYRVAGYYTMSLLWLALAAWALTLVIWVIRPRLGALWLTGLGGLLVFTAALHSILVNQSETQLAIPVGDAILRPEPGSSFYLLLISGVLALVAGLLTLLAFARRDSGSPLADLASAAAGLGRHEDEKAEADEEERRAAELSHVQAQCGAQTPPPQKKSPPRYRLSPARGPQPQGLFISEALEVARKRHPLETHV